MVTNMFTNTVIVEFLFGDVTLWRKDELSVKLLKYTNVIYIFYYINYINRGEENNYC